MSDVADPDAAQGGTASAGTLLRRAREAAGLHIAALAVSLKVPVRKLEALESDRWDELPDPVFARALAASMCRALKVDAGPILALLPRANPTMLREDSTLEGSSLPGGSPVALGAGFRTLVRPPGLWVVTLLLGALVLAIWPKTHTETPVPTEATTPPAVTSQSQAAVTSNAVEAVAQSTPQAAHGPPSSPVTVSSAATVVSGAAPIISFRAKATAWVEVIDTRQVVVLRRTLAPGETATAEGQPPLAVVVGRVDGTEVAVRGQPFDMTAVSRDNVARFEVK